MDEEVGKKRDRGVSTDHQPSAPHGGVSTDHQTSVQPVQPATITPREKMAEAYKKFANSVFTGRALMIREASLRQSAPLKKSLLLAQMISQASDDIMEDNGPATTDSLALKQIGRASRELAEAVFSSDTAIIAREGKIKMPKTDF